MLLRITAAETGKDNNNYNDPYNPLTATAEATTVKTHKKHLLEA
jgi:hypothetical protein